MSSAQTLSSSPSMDTVFSPSTQYLSMAGTIMLRPRFWRPRGMGTRNQNNPQKHLFLHLRDSLLMSFLSIFKKAYGKPKSLLCPSRSTSGNSAFSCRSTYRTFTCSCGQVRMDRALQFKKTATTATKDQKKEWQMWQVKMTCYYLGTLMNQEKVADAAVVAGLKE